MQTASLDDWSVDFICSHAVIDNVHGVSACFWKMARLPKPGGLMIQRFDPHFSLRGGHVCWPSIFRGATSD